MLGCHVLTGYYRGARGVSARGAEEGAGRQQRRGQEGGARHGGCGGMRALRLSRHYFIYGLVHTWRKFADLQHAGYGWNLDKVAKFPNGNKCTVCLKVTISLSYDKMRVILT